MATAQGRKVLAVNQPKNDNTGPGSQAKTVTRAGYPKGNDACPPNKVGQKGKMTKTHQGLYN